ncbi:MAG: hypothetical protein B7Y31_11975 [Novosphingobium sp. 16-62-11]|nr:MAG: hypothetical protein B7Y31_11975 [Novosphingobium sp. 16-62-11]
MSLPRRLSLRRVGATLTLVQTVEPSCRAQFAAAEIVALGDGCRPLGRAALVEAPAREDWQFTLADDAGRTLECAFAAGLLHVIRRDPVTPQLDHTSTITVTDDEPIEIWLDSGSIEVLASKGADCLTLQHRLAGEAFGLRGEGALTVRYPLASA